MSAETDYVEPTSDSFWEIGQYKRTVKRCEDGYRLCNDVVQMIAERADLEKQYAKSLKAWSKRWQEYLQKGSEYGSMRVAWSSSLVEADKLAEIHMSTHNVLVDELSKEIKEWQKQSYPKSIVSQLKTAKEYEEEFKKAQKPWSKKYTLVEKCKKEYHAACKSCQTAKVQLANAQNDVALSAEQKKKLEDKMDKYKKEVEITKSKYKQALDDLNAYNSHYIEDMNVVYKKCDLFEKERLEFFIQRFVKLHGHLNIYDKANVEDVYADFLRTVKQANPDKDLASWSKEYGSGMPMSWPVFEEYSEELKSIASASTKLGKQQRKDLAGVDMVSNGSGVTMTSIKKANNDEYAPANNNNNNNNDASSASLNVNGGSTMDSRSYKTQNSDDPWADSSPHSYDNFSLSSQHSSGWNASTKGKSGAGSGGNKPNGGNVANPFGDDDEDEDNSGEHAARASEFMASSGVGGATNKTSSSNDTNNDDDSDEDDGHNEANYLNIRVKALYDYASTEDDELSFKAGEEFIKLAMEDERGWCLGKLGEKVGLYPATYAVNV